MCKSLVVLSLFALPAPVLAQSYPDAEAYSNAVPPQEEIDRTALQLHRVLDALMDVRVGPIVEAVDPEAAHDPYRRNETLGDMAARDDPYYRERMHDSIGAATAGMGEMMTRMARLAPVLQRSLEEVERSIEEAIEDAPGHDRYPD